MDTSRTPGKRIGVLTFHRCINYGSYWQAKCLVGWLKAFGHHPVLIDHGSRRITLAEFKCAFRPTLPIKTPVVHRLKYRAKIEKFQQAFARLPLSPAVHIDNPQDLQHYDLVIVGSDEVWNLAHPWYGGYPIFFGENVKRDRLISYAASFGNYHAWAGLETQWAERLGNFDAISVRDDNSSTLTSGALGEYPVKVVDPCLLYPPTRPAAHESSQPYVAVYGHGFSDEFASAVRKWASSNSLRTISVGYNNPWADEQRMDAGPDDFLTIISKAEAVVTNFFHGCVFSLCFNKSFVAEATPYRNIKVSDLLNTFGLVDRLQTWGDPSGVTQALDHQLPRWLPEKIDSYRSMSEEYLLNNL